MCIINASGPLTGEFSAEYVFHGQITGSRGRHTSFTLAAMVNTNILNANGTITRIARIGVVIMTVNVFMINLRRMTLHPS